VFVASATAHIDRPTQFREVFASGEFRALYAASALSWVGDFAARAAVTFMVYARTGSAAASGAAFAISFAPWLLGGSVLVAVAERYPYRRVMVWCDLARMMVMAVLAVLGARMALPALLALLLLCALFTPPFDAARSATMPQVLGPERYVAGLGLSTAMGAPVQVIGYLLGSAISAKDPQLALALNAATFGFSALLVRFGLRLREPGLRRERRTGLLRETGEGFRIVFSNPVLRALVLLVFAASLFAIVPEGLGAAWASGDADGAHRAWAQGLLMAAVPTGMVLGALAAGRLLRPSWRLGSLRPLAFATPLALVPTIIDPPIVVVAALALISGFAVGALVPMANGEFVQAVPSAYRARAFGVVSAGLQLLQGLAVLATGVLAVRAELPIVVGLWSLAGVVLMIGITISWPTREVFAEASERKAAMDAGAEVAETTPTVRS
jgi:Major Facilitator Superfamily